MVSLFFKSLTGTKWTLAATIFHIALQIVFSAVLARLLEPTAFGLMAMANVVMHFASYFVRMGIGPAVIQAKELSDGDIDFAFTFSICLGLIVTLLVGLCSPLLALAFAKPELVQILRVVGFSLLLTASSSTALGLLTREMKFKQIAILETIAYILGSGVVGIYLAYSGYGVWSLVGALLASSMITAALALIALRRKYRIHFSFVEHKHLLHFGSRFSFNSFLEYIGSSLDTFITGRVFSANMLGFYNRAFMLANLPTQFLITSITRVMYPTFAKLQSNKQHLAEAEQMLLAVVGSLSMAVCLGMLPAAKDIVLVLLGQKWMESVRVLEILLLAVPLNFMSHVLALTFDAVGELKRKTRIQIVSISFLAISLVFLLPLGLSGIASAVVVSTAIKLGLYITQTKKVMAVPIIKQMKVVLEAVVAGLVVFAGIRIVSAAVANASIAPIVALFFEIVTGGFAITLFFLMNIPKLLGFEQTAEIGAYVRKYVRERLGGQNA